MFHQGGGGLRAVASRVVLTKSGCADGKEVPVGDVVTVLQILLNDVVSTLSSGKEDLDAL